jgi:heat-inducible transcriptional repressor
VVVGALEDDDVDFDSILSSDDGGLVVRIGRENPDDRLSSVSVVAKEYWAGTGMGFVCCVGPTRMDYKRTIGAVEAGAAEAGAVYSGLDATT